MKEEIDLNISFYKAGNAGISSRITLPRKWVKDMGLTPENKAVKMKYEDGVITIKKIEKNLP